MSRGATGSAVFTTFLGLFSDHFDRASKGDSFGILHGFVVPSDVPFSGYLRAFRLVTTSVGEGRPLRPSADIPMELVRLRTAQQYPTPMLTLYLRGDAAIESLFSTFDEKWLSFNALVQNTTPAISGNAFPPLLSSASATPGEEPRLPRPRPPHSCTTRITGVVRALRRGARRRGSVMNVSHTTEDNPTHGHDPFEALCDPPFDERAYDIVFAVSTSINTRDPPIVLDPAALGFRHRPGTPPSHNTEPGNFLKHCGTGWENAFQLLNPSIGQNNDGSRLFERWQQRMRSYHPRKHHNSSNVPSS